MKKILFILSLFISFVSFGQTYQAMPQAGYGPINRMLFNRNGVLSIPMGITDLNNISGGRDTSQIRYNKLDSSVYIYTGHQWLKVSSSASSKVDSVTISGINICYWKSGSSTCTAIDTSIISTKYYVTNYVDSSIAINNYYTGNSTCLPTLLDGSIIWVNGFNFSNTKLKYLIGCQLDSVDASNFSISAADTTDRYTIIYADTLGQLHSQDGTVGAVASIPTIDPSSQILLATYFIPANSTQPQLLSANTVYKENTTGEWVGSSNILSASFSYPTEPCFGLYSTHIDNFANTNYIYYADGVDHFLNNTSFLYFYIKIGTAFTSSNSIVIYFRNPTGTVAYKTIYSGTNGFNGQLLNECQLVAVPINTLTPYSSATNFNGIEFQFQGSGGAVQLDNIILQSGGNNQNSTGVPSVNGQTGAIKIRQKYNTDSTYSILEVNGVDTDSLGLIIDSLTPSADSTIRIVNVGRNHIISAIGGGSGSSQFRDTTGGVYLPTATGGLAIGTAVPGADRLYVTGGTYPSVKVDVNTGTGNYMKILTDDYGVGTMLLSRSMSDGLFRPFVFRTTGAAINNTGDLVDGSAMLDVSSTTKGVLFPRLTQTLMNAVSTPASGLMITNTDSLNRPFIYTGTAWKGLAFTDEGGGGGSSTDTLFYNIDDFGAVGNGVTDDRPALLLAIAAANSAGGGVVYMPRRYYISDSVLLTKSVRIQGVLNSGGLNNNQSALTKDRFYPQQRSSVIYSGANKSVFVIDTASDGSKPTLAVQWLTFIGDTTGSATAGNFIKIKGNLQDVDISDNTFFGGYVHVNSESAFYAKIVHNHFSAPTYRCLILDNIIRGDTGDGIIDGNTFSSGNFTTSTAIAIDWRGGGGRRISNNKFDASSNTLGKMFVNCIKGDNTHEATSIIQINNNSFENMQFEAIKFNFSNTFYHFLLTSNQFLQSNPTTPMVDITGASFVIIDEYSVLGSATAQPVFKLTTCDKVTIGLGEYYGYASLYSLTSCTNTGILNRKQVLVDTVSTTILNGLHIGRGNNSLVGNVGIGDYILNSITTGTGNTATGYQTLFATTTGVDNTGHGAAALRTNTTGNYNTATGFNAMYNNLSGSENTGNGYSALLYNTASNNTATGSTALLSNTSGSGNTADGRQALYLNSTGSDNTAMGHLALRFSTSSSNTAVGSGTLYGTTSGGVNTAIGLYAGTSNTTGQYNVFLGHFAGAFSTTADQQIFIDGLNRGSYSNDQNGAPFYAQTNATVSSQKVTLNGNIGINTISPDASAVLDIPSTTKGILPPRMTTTQRTAISSPAEGLMVYDLTLHKLYVYDGTTWQAAW